MAKRIRFDCTRCREPTDAPQDTRRATQELCRTCFGKGRDTRKNELNGLTGKEWAALSKSVEEYPGNRSEKQKAHGACYPISLAEAHISIYTKRGQLVFDPFMGVGTTAEAAENLGRKSIGIELSKEFIKLANTDIKSKKNHRIIHADIRTMLKHIKPNSIDFQLTSPPYANLLKTVKGEFAYKWKEHSTLNSMSNPKPYSKDNKDIGNLPYQEFMETIHKVFEDTMIVLKDGAYAAWVVKDYRDLKHKKPYVNFHSDIILAAESAGMTLWDIRIYDQTRFRPLVVLGYPSKNYYLNIGHSYIIIFRKYLTGKYAKNNN